MPKRYLGIDVLTAAKERISWTFDNFERIFISFSGGKDSTAMTHLVMEEAIKRDRKVGLFFVDWECQFTMTIDHIQKVFDMYEDNIEPFWVCLPMTTWNGCSQFETEWTAWDEEKEFLWVRKKPKIAIKKQKYFPFYYGSMTFEEFTPLFAKWYSQGEECANFIGIRSQESLNRFRTIANTKKKLYGEKLYTTNVVDDCYSVYPIYDWETEDDWTYFSKFKKSYNKLYDRMHQAGLTIHQMRIDEPFGDTQRQGLWLYQIIEPEMWAKMCARVAGANNGALYAHDAGNVLGNKKLVLPNGHTWKSFVNFLLETMPHKTAEHYRNKIAVYLNWYKTRGYPDDIPDQADNKLETYGKVPAWRRICKTVLRNDYWCRNLGFAPTKSTAYGKYMDLMRRRRKKWDIYSETVEEEESEKVE
jgi:predicted phosphoadenosine phosphosulfate sulfurtransferase